MFTIILLSRVYNLIIFLKKNGRLVMFSYCVAKLMAYILLPWRFMPDYVEEGTEAEIGAAANIEPWLT
mgnify:CR=1 FL=1